MFCSFCSDFHPVITVSIHRHDPLLRECRKRGLGILERPFMAVFPVSILGREAFTLSEEWLGLNYTDFNFVGTRGNTVNYIIKSVKVQ